MKRGDFTAARDYLIESDRLDPANGTKLNLALCHIQLDEILAAFVLTQTLLETLPKHDQRRAYVEQLHAALDKRIPRARLVPNGTLSESATLHLDGVELGRASVGPYFPVSPGEHTIAVSDRGVSSKQDFTVAEGERTEVPLVLPKVATRLPASEHHGLTAAGPLRAAQVPVEPQDRREDQHRRRPRVGLALIGVGGANVFASVAFTSLLVAAGHTIDNHCSDGECTSQTGIDATERARRLNVAATVTGIVGLALVSAGTIVVVLDKRHRARQAGQRPPSSRQSGPLRF